MVDGEGTIEVIVLTGSNVNNISQLVEGIGGKYESLGYNYGIVTIPIDNLTKLEALDEIQYIELPKELYFSDASSNRASCVQTAQSSYSVDGSGVLVGFIDTGIDYMHPAFRNADGTTRIEYIYDLSLNGSVYNKETYKIRLYQMKYPSSIAPSADLSSMELMLQV